MTDLTTDVTVTIHGTEMFDGLQSAVAWRCDLPSRAGCRDHEPL